MNTKASNNPDSNADITPSAEKSNPFSEATREAFRALPVKQRAVIFRTAYNGAPVTLPKLLHAAHIPKSFQPSRIAHWLNPVLQNKLEEVVLSPEHAEWFSSLLRGFFGKAHKPLNEVFRSSIASTNEVSTSVETALETVRQQFPKDPFLSLHSAAIRWLFHHAMSDGAAFTENCGSDLTQGQVESSGKPNLEDPGVPAGSSNISLVSGPDEFAELDKELLIVSEAIAKLGALQPVEVAPAITALQRAQELTATVAEELRTLAIGADVIDPKWSCREEFIALRERVANLADSRAKMNQRAMGLVGDLGKLFSGVCVRHRLPSRSLALTSNARSVVDEITSYGDAFKLTLISHSGTALDWLKWLWQQEGVGAESVQQQLQPISPALAKLLADAEWRDLHWPEPAASDATSVSSEKLHTLAAPKAVVPPALASTPIIPEVAAHPQSKIVTSERDDTSESHAPSSVRDAALYETESLGRNLNQSLAEEPIPVATSTSGPNIVDSEPIEIIPTGSSVVPELKPAETEAAVVTETAQIVLPDRDKTEIVRATWRLAASGRWGLASHLAALEASAALPPAWVFEAAALAPLLDYEVSPFSERLTESFSRSADFRPESISPDILVATRILLAAVALRPALLAPRTNAASVLKLSEVGVVPKLQSLGRFVEAVAEFGLHQQALQPDMLLSSHNLDDWEQHLARVRAEIIEWVAEAPLRGFNYALAAKIWRKWTGNSGPLSQLLRETSEADANHFIPIRNQWEPWSKNAAALVQSGIRELNHRKSMDGTARDTLIARIGEAVQLADRIFALLAQKPKPVATFRTEQVNQLLASRKSNLHDARQELNIHLSASHDEATMAAVQLCDAALEQVECLLQGRLPLPGGNEPNPRWIINAELLRDPAFQICSDGTLGPFVHSTPEALVALAQTSPDWKDAWTRQIKGENHLATASLLEFFRWQHPPGLEIVELEDQRTLALQSCRHRLENESSDTRRLLDEFVSLGLCRELDYDTWTAEVDNVKQAVESALEFASLSARLAKVRLNVQQQKDAELLGVRQRLDASPTVAVSVRTRITALLDSGDIHTAIDYLDLVAKNIPLPELGSPPSIFMGFFGDNGWLRKSGAALRDASINECWQAANDGSTWNGLDFQFLSVDQRANSVSQLQLWQNLERKRLATDEDVNKLVSALGLQPIKVTAQSNRTGTYRVHPFGVIAQIINERSAALVPAFGSDANGRYTLHLVWGEPDAEELLSLCGRATGDLSAHIIVTFRFLTTKGRYELAEEARKSERTFKGVVVDSALFAYICAQPTARFSTLLRCALPFSCVEPYSIAAGEVPPEMFFGRGRELDSLAEPRGSCFVYGGRQLGKTALLRALERRFHNLDQGRAAIFVDLKRELFSRGRGIDALWSVLVTRLKEVGVLNDVKVGATAGQEALFRHINEWLKLSPDHRLIFLLDEADTFLEEDGRESEHFKSFPRCQLLKGLMDDTGRRFKVVLAGLHNVQRTTHNVNHPLAHFGEAICIGPMLEEAESREARALVEQPLAAAGYFFDSPDVVSRILALTNYYPSLIQIFCHHLLVDLRANHVTRFQNPRSTPPCVITSQHVQTAYGSRVREAIHIKVGLTLDLDKRYKLIARLLAFYHANQIGDNGVELRDIRSDSAAYWPAGFSDLRADDEFRCLLEEMVGLGILRQIRNTGRFALRNQNVTTLLGNPEEIARQLDEAKSWEPALKYEADKFRRLLAEKPKLIFSPLTVQQESELKAPQNRVAVLYGLPVAGLAQIPAAMASDSLFGKSRTSTVSDCSDAVSLADRIARCERPPQSNTIIIVPHGLSWDETWVTAAQARIETFTSKDAFLTVLFIADPHRAAATFQRLEGARNLGIREFTLRPWDDAAVRQWLEDHGVVGENAVRKLIHQATGNWQELLMRLDISNAKDLPQACADLERMVKQPGQLSELHAAFGFSKEGEDQSLRIAAQLQQFTVEEVCDYSELPDANGHQMVAECIDRAERLGLISIAGNRLEFDPVAAIILLKANS